MLVVLLGGELADVATGGIPTIIIAQVADTNYGRGRDTNIAHGGTTPTSARRPTFNSAECPTLNIS